MPITLAPITRRNYITGSLVLGGSAWIKSYALAKQPTFDPNRVALLADTHISDDPKRSYPGTKWPGSPVKEDEHEWVNMADSLAQSVREIIALKPRPANLIINGDCALSRGTEAEYKEFLRLIEPIRRAGITVHITIGNHDNREKLWKLLPFLKKEQMGIHADMIELPNANIFLLDSGKKESWEKHNWTGLPSNSISIPIGLLLCLVISTPCQIGAYVQSGECGMEKLS